MHSCSSCISCFTLEFRVFFFFIIFFFGGNSCCCRARRERVFVGAGPEHAASTAGQRQSSARSCSQNRALGDVCGMCSRRGLLRSDVCRVLQLVAFVVCAGTRRTATDAAAKVLSLSSLPLVRALCSRSCQRKGAATRLPQMRHLAPCALCRACLGAPSFRIVAVRQMRRLRELRHAGCAKLARKQRSVRALCG